MTPLGLLFSCENQLVIFNEDRAAVPGGYGCHRGTLQETSWHILSQSKQKIFIPNAEDRPSADDLKLHQSSSNLNVNSSSRITGFPLGRD